MNIETTQNRRRNDMQDVATTETPSIEQSAAEMKNVARVRAMADQQRKRPRTVQQPEPAETATSPATDTPRKRGRPRGGDKPALHATGPVAAIKLSIHCQEKLIKGHLREIRQLQRALRLVGG
jgi:hypothetical protein